MSGRVRAAASWSRRGTTPQRPPASWFSIARPRQPTPMPTQKSQARRYERKNWSRSRAKPAASTTRKRPPTRRPAEPLAGEARGRARERGASRAAHRCVAPRGRRGDGWLELARACPPATSAAGAYWLSCSART